MEKTVEKSQRQANIIKTIAVFLIELDVEYCREMAKDMHKQALMQESMAVLNQNHPQVKNDILKTQSHALAKLCDYIDNLRSIDELKLKLKEQEETQREISKLFT